MSIPSENGKFLVILGRLSMHCVRTHRRRSFYFEIRTVRWPEFRHRRHVLFWFFCKFTDYSNSLPEDFTFLSTYGPLSILSRCTRYVMSEKFHSPVCHEFRRWSQVRFFFVARVQTWAEIVQFQAKLSAFSSKVYIRPTRYHETRQVFRGNC